MKKWMKKSLALVACMTLVMSMLAACGGSGTTTTTPNTNTAASTESTAATSTVKETDPSKMPLIKIAIPNSGNYDNNDKVTAEVNKILAEKLGVQVQFLWQGFGSYAQQLNLMLTTAGEVDIFEVGGGPNNYYNNGQLLDLTDYWAGATDDFKSLFPQAYIDANSIGGRVYAIPAKINFSNEILVHANKEYVDGMGIEMDDEKIWSLEEIHDLVKQAMEAYPGIIGIAPQSGSQLINQLNWESLGDSYSIGVVPDRGASRKVISITECEEFINFSKTMHEWYNEGLIMQDVLSNTEGWSAVVPTGRAFCDLDAGAYPNGETTDASLYYNLTIYPNWSASNCAVRIGYAIAGNTKYPAEAFAVLQELYTNPEICDLISWGVEGENYITNENGQVEMPEGVTLENNTWTVGNVNIWILPNMMKAKLDSSRLPGAWDRLMAYDDNAEISGCMGVVFNSEAVANEYTACINAYNKYYAAILSGAMETEATLEQYKAELEASGEAAVIAEKQKQIDAVYGN